MNHSLSIGGIDFSVEVPKDIDLQPPGPFYAPFRETRAARAGAVGVSVEVVLHRGTPQPVEGRPVLFDTGQSWFAQRDGADLLLLFRGVDASRGLLCSARLTGDRRRVDVVCGEYLWPERPGTSHHDPFTYPLDQLVTMMVLAHRRRGAILHAAGVLREGRAVACIGVSGAGKSTLVKHLGSGYEAVSDDRVIARVDGVGEQVLFGSPWTGEGNVARPDAAPLAALAFLKQAPSTRARPLKNAEALRLLLPAISVPWFDEKATTQVLGVAEQLLDRVPAYELSFRPDPEVRRVIASLF